MRNRPLVCVFCALATGVLVDCYCPVPFVAWWVAAVLGLAWWCHFWYWGRDRSAVWLLLVALAALAGAWHHDRWRLFSAVELGRFATEFEEPVCLEAVALGSPRRHPPPPPNAMCTIVQGERTQIELAVQRLRDADAWRVASGTVSLLVEGQVRDVQPGDHLRVYAGLSRPAPVCNPGEFDFAAAERRERRLCRLRADSAACIVRLERNRSWRFRRLLHDVREEGGRLLWRHVHPTRAGLAAAILLGAREELDRNRTDLFFMTGTVHLLSISGLHVGILAYGFWWLARLGPMSRRGTLVAAFVLVIVYAALTAAGPPVVRAAVLIGTVCCAKLVGRQTQPSNTLSLAALVVLAMNPESLFQTGAQLSFLAVAILFLSRGLFGWESRSEDPLDRLIAKSRPWPERFARRQLNWVWSLTAVSAAVWLFTLPLVMYRFHLVTPAAIALNPLVCFPTSVALFSGFGVLLLGSLAPPLASLCGSLCDASLCGVEWLIEKSRAVDGAYFWTPSPPLWWVVGFYAGATVAAALPRTRRLGFWLAVVAAGWFGLGFWYPRGLERLQREPLKSCLACTFVSVGHGTSVLLEFPDGYTLLYDAGRQGIPASAARSVSSLLWSRGLTHLDALVLSHADTDHFSAVPDLLERFSVGVAYVSPVMFSVHSPALAALQRAFRNHHTALRVVAAGDRLKADVCSQMDVVHPPSSGASGGDNANSLVLRIGFQGKTILLPGDLESQGLEVLTGRGAMNCDLVMAPHHGSHRSNPLGFTTWSTPEWVVISGGLRRNTRELIDTFAVAGATVMHTAQGGAVRVTLSASQVDVRCWRYNRW